jgi:L-aspartate oxidase
MSQYDYIIIGSGIAGLYTALLAREHGSVLIITKGSIEDCNTKHAQGGIAAAIGSNDSSELHFNDTLKAGDGLVDPEAAKILANEAPDRIYDLVRFGVPFDTVNGEIALTKEAAHSIPRILHAGGDATGAHIEFTLSSRVREQKITVLEYCLVTDILVENNTVKGVRALDLRIGSIEEYDCRFLILASGGAGHLYKYTTNPDVATGDGIALACKAGA